MNIKEQNLSSLLYTLMCVAHQSIGAS